MITLPSHLHTLTPNDGNERDSSMQLSRWCSAQNGGVACLGRHREKPTLLPSYPELNSLPVLHEINEKSINLGKWDRPLRHRDVATIYYEEH